MVSIAALMVVVACHPQQSSCIERPVAVISYASTMACRAALPAKLAALENLPLKIYGNCVPVEASLLAGRPVIQTEMSEAELRALASLQPPATPIEAMALKN